MTSVLQSKLEKIQITQSLLDNLDYDTGFEQANTMTPWTGNEPLALFVFHQSDLDAASYYLAKSLADPLHPGAIKCAFVQESCVDRFAAKLKAKLKPYSQDDTKLSSSLTKANEIISKLSAKTIRPDSEHDLAPTVVYDFPQEHFTVEGSSPVVTLYTFRTVKEAISLSKKEAVLKHATIWSENHAAAYEVIAGTSLNNYYLNCCNVPWTPIQDAISNNQPTALIENSYHYETLVASGIQKNIVFPFGTSFAN